MTAYTATQTGNWSAAATWGGTDPATFVPGTDTCTIPATLTGAVTLDTSITIPATTVEEDVYGLVQATGVTTTLGGALTLGNGSAKDGKFTFGAGATLAMGSYGIVHNNCIINSNATSGNWAKVTGSGSILRGAVYAYPKQDWNISYVSFQNTGTNAHSASGLSGGTITNRISLPYCTFQGQTAIWLGHGGATPTTTGVTINNSDFRDCGDVIFYGLSDATTSLNAQHCTFSRAASGWSNVQNGRASAVLDLTGSVLIGYASPSTAVGKIKWSGSFGAWNSLTTAGDNSGITPFSNISEAIGAYWYAPATVINPHISGTSSAITVQDGVIEMYGATGSDGGNAFSVSGASGVNTTLSKMLFIGSGAAINNVGAHAGGAAIDQCTVVTTQHDSYVKPTAFWLSENGEMAGSVTIKNSMHVGIGGTADYFLRDNDANVQVFAEADFNNIYNVATKKSGVTVTAGETNDLTVNPDFVDATRSFLTWKGSESAGYAALLAINGYNATTKTQSDTPSTDTPAVARDWVRAGFAPQNTALKGAGYGGVDIGAMAVVGSPFKPFWALNATQTIRGY